MDSDTLLRSSLGRSANLGDLYDARTDNFTGFSLIKTEIPNVAIKTNDNHFTNVEFIHSDTLEEKFDKLNVKAELKVSTLGGLFSLEGSGQFLNEDKASSKTVKLSLLYNITTADEHLNFFHDEMINRIALEALKMEKPTHVLAKISWGANTVITAEYKKSESRKNKLIEGELKAHFTKFGLTINGMASVELKNDETSKKENYSLKIFGDVLAKGEEIPQTFEKALQLIKRIPEFVEKANGGKGKPLTFTLVPLSAIRNFFCPNAFSEKILHNLEESAIIQVVHLFDEINEKKSEINDFYSDALKFKFCVDLESLQNIRKLQKDNLIQEASLKSKLAKTLVAIRSGSSEASTLYDLIVEYQHNDFDITQFAHVRKKINFAQSVLELDATYIGKGDSLDQQIIKHSEKNIYLLNFSTKFVTKDKEIWAKNRNLFIRMMKTNRKEMLRKNKTNELNNEENKTNEEKTKFAKGGNIENIFILLDLDLNPNLSNVETITIQHYRNGKCICQDLVAQRENLGKTCFAKADQIHPINSTPKKRVTLTIECPSPDCSNDEHEWLCEKCKEKFEYGFDNHFYCKCGREHFENFGYKCNEGNHGNDFERYSNMEYFKLLIEKLRPFREMNILILGEKGVGKSTWINSFANYLIYNNLDEGLENENLINLIPSNFLVCDVNHQVKLVSTGRDKNECDVPGQCSTQRCLIHKFVVDNTVLRLIDTPGIADVRGIEMDSKNMENIMRTISLFDEIHSILILLKPESKPYFNLRFVVKELLSHFHKDVVKNISFVFTNTRGNSYEPGEALQNLKEILEGKKEIEFPMSNHVIYSMDNEPFKFLAATKKGIEFGDDEKIHFAKSWEKSALEMQRLFSFIKNSKSHKIKNSILLNDARKIICKLANVESDIEGFEGKEDKNEEKSVEEKMSDKIIEQKEKFENEELNIEELNLKFGTFLKTNSIFPYNDETINYLDHLIKEQNDFESEDGKNFIVEKIEYMKKTLQSQMEIIESVMVNINNNDQKKTNNLNELVQTLCSSSKFGKEFMEMNGKLTKFNENSFVFPNDNNSTPTILRNILSSFW